MSKFFLYYNEEGMIQTISPTEIDGIGQFIRIPEKKALTFTSGKESFRNWKVDTRTEPFKLKSTLQQTNNVAPTLLFQVTDEIDDLIEGEDITLCYEKEDKEITITHFSKFDNTRMFFITPVNNPLILLQTITIAPDEIEIKVKIDSYPFSVYTWKSDEVIKYEER